MVETIPADDLWEWLDGGRSATLVDTRGRESFESWRMPGAVNYRFEPGGDVDADDFRERTGLERDDDVAVVCAKGISSYDFADGLEAAGYENVTVVEDGMEGWSRVYDAVDVPTPGPAEIVQFQRRAKGCLSYVVADPDAGEAAVVDPTRHVERYEALADERRWTITAVFDTHVHADHISGGRRLAERADAPYYLGDRAAQRVAGNDSVPLGRNEVVRVGDVDVKAVETPGHTSGAVSYLVDATAILTGDTVFVDSVGRTELQFGEGDADDGARQLYRSIHGSVLAQPDGLAVLPGHFPVASDGTAPVTHGQPVSTTVRALRTDLPLLQTDEATFVAEVTGSLPAKPSNYDSIIDINSGRRQPDDDGEAAELETGPNNCAATGD